MLSRFTLATIFVFVVLATSPSVPGLLDTSFDNDGIAITQIGMATDRANAIALQADGKIVAAGSTNNVDGANQDDFGLVRYNADGSLDNSFDLDGKVVTPISNFNDIAYAIAIQPDGKIVAAGYANPVEGSATFALARYNPNGSLDPSFDFNGIVITQIGEPSAAVASAVAIQPDGKIVVGGRNIGVGFALARYNPDGSLDTSFDADGIVITPVGSGGDVKALVMQSDGKIVVAGYSTTNIQAFALARYNPDGSLDTSFDGDGFVRTPIGVNSIAQAAAIQSNGKIVVAGRATFGTISAHPDVALLRYNENGSVDTSFGIEGTVITSIT